MCWPTKDYREKFYEFQKFRMNFFRSWLLEFFERKFYKGLDLYIRWDEFVESDWTIFAELQWLCNLLLSFNVIKKYNKKFNTGLFRYMYSFFYFFFFLLFNEKIFSGIFIEEFNKTKIDFVSIQPILSFHKFMI